jgi:uroporphyrinogen decarboxylase
MLPRERVIQTIKHEKPDRIPIYGWVKANLEQQISEVFGSVEAFEDRYEFDYAHLFGGPPTFDEQVLQELRANGPIEPPALIDAPMHDPNDTAAFNDIVDQIRHHKEQRGRFVYMQTPGFFEAMNGVFGIENHLAYLLIFENELHEVYRRQAEWTIQFVNNCLDLGVDMIHVSDDWGAQNSLMFSPDVWWRLIFPYHKTVVDAVKRRGAFVSLHTDGNNMSVLDGIAELGYDVLHPFQESAGMDYSVYKSKYADKFVLMGGLDVQTTIGFGKLDFLRSEIKRVMSMFADGGLLFCTSHFVQDHCTMDELIFAFDTIYETARGRF